MSQNIVSQSSGKSEFPPESLFSISEEPDNINLSIPEINLNDSIFKKMANKDSFSPDEVYKVVTAISKKEASKKMIENFMANLKTMAEESKLKETQVINEPFQKHQPVSGRNAYELRTDILQMSVDFLCRNNKYGQKKTADDVLAMAKKFYSFVENKR